MLEEMLKEWLQQETVQLERIQSILQYIDKEFIKELPQENFSKCLNRLWLLYLEQQREQDAVNTDYDFQNSIEAHAVSASVSHTPAEKTTNRQAAHERRQHRRRGID